jgi:RHS repeat protein
VGKARTEREVIGCPHLALQQRPTHSALLLSGELRILGIIALNKDAAAEAKCSQPARWGLWATLIWGVVMIRWFRNNLTPLVTKTDPLAHAPPSAPRWPGEPPQLAYDANGNVRTITDPLQNPRSFTYDSTFNTVTSSTDPPGNLTTPRQARDRLRV